MSSRLTPRRLVAAALVVVGVALACWALLRGPAPRDGYADGPDPVTAGRVVDPVPDAAGEHPHGRDPAVGRTPGVPTRLVVPALHIDAPVVRIGVDGRDAHPARTTRRCSAGGSDGAVPGARTGSALITGHTVHTGGGAMDDLETLRGRRPGDRRDAQGRRGLPGERGDASTARRRWRRTPHGVFSQERPGRLVLITCEDWDGTKYLSNAVVVARPA